MTDCRECKHGQKIVNLRRLCDVGLFTRPIEFMRDEQSECGHDGNLFEKAERRYAEFDDV